MVNWNLIHLNNIPEQKSLLAISPVSFHRRDADGFVESLSKGTFVCRVQCLGHTSGA